MTSIDSSCNGSILKEHAQLRIRHRWPLPSDALNDIINYKSDIHFICHFTHRTSPATYSTFAHILRNENQNHHLKAKWRETFQMERNISKGEKHSKCNFKDKSFIEPNQRSIIPETPSPQPRVTPSKVGSNYPRPSTFYLPAPTLPHYTFFFI